MANKNVEQKGAPQGIWQSSLLVALLVLAVALGSTAIAAPASREQLLSAISVGGVIALIAGLLAAISQWLATVARRRGRAWRSIAFVTPYAVPAMIAGFSWYSEGGTGEPWSGLMEQMALYVICGCLAALLAAKFLKSRGMLDTWRSLGLAFAGLGAVTMAFVFSLPSRTQIDETRAQLARLGHWDCAGSLDEAAKIKAGVRELEAEQGWPVDGTLDSDERTRMLALPDKREWKIDAKNKDSGFNLKQVLTRLCNVSGKVHIALGEGVYSLEADYNVSFANYTGSNEQGTGRDSLQVELVGAGRDKTQIDAASGVLALVDGDSIHDLTIRQTGQPDSELLSINGSDSGLFNVALVPATSAAAKNAVRISPIENGNVTLDQIDIGPVSEGLIRVTGISSAKADATSTVRVTRSRLVAGKGVGIWSQSEATIIVEDTEFLSGSGLFTAGKGKLTASRNSFRNQDGPVAEAIDSSQIILADNTMQSRTENTYCLLARDRAQLIVKNNKMDDCYHSGKFMALVDNNATAEFTNNSGIYAEDINQPSKEAKLAFTPPPQLPSANQATPIQTSSMSSLAASTYTSDRDIRYRKWLLYNYLDPLSRKAIDCSFVTGSNQWAASGAATGGMICMFLGGNCRDSLRQSQDKILSEQAQCMTEMQSRVNTVTQRAISNPDSCPRMSKALVSFSDWWFKAALEATKMYDKGQQTDVRYRTRAFNKIAGESLIKLMDRNHC